MQNVAVRSQGKTDTCYAQAASAMIDAFAKIHKIKNVATDPYILALQTRQTLEGAGLDNFSCNAINMANKLGSCNKDKLKLSEHKNINDLISNIQNFHKPVKLTLSNYKNIKNLYDKYSEDKKANATALTCYLSQNSSIPLDSNSLHDFESILGDLTSGGFISDFTKVICKDFTTSIKPKMNCYFDKRVWHGSKQKSEAYKRQLNSQLERKDAGPIAVGYCGNLLTEGANYRGFKESMFGFTSSEVLNCGLHESLVIGRKKIGDKCFYKIRNSWGLDGAYHKDWSSLPNHARDGNVWIDENTLTENMGSLSYIR